MRLVVLEASLWSVSCMAVAVVEIAQRPYLWSSSSQSSKSLLVVAADAWFLPVVAALIIMSCFSEGYLTDWTDKNCEGREQLFPVFITIKPPGSVRAHFYFVQCYDKFIIHQRPEREERSPQLSAVISTHLLFYLSWCSKLDQLDALI